ncbi:DNA polymerase III subunit psi [Vibrio sp. ZSDZ34]|jgi:DNA polymerase-3 subunit psi|uniref:DNA polymerase III subunit psi n=1 Tax=Vibrio gelatinilyticus TaxID=2893468 RepID=A0A9X1WAH3_9VIBR|nr:DNA polymerase III subunit psi [Vibrio gelatinilyticus]MCJ2375815.1 DNA polymerase III subunit psi [Vibrio gelatinilyticus]
MNQDRLKLQHMGIQAWDVAHPERLQGFVPQPIAIPESCRLLLVSPENPSGELAEFYSRILKAMKLELSQSRHIEPDHLVRIQASGLEWIWFAGCENESKLTEHLAMQESATKLLSSPLISGIQGNDHQRRTLWNQIRSYE